MAKKSLYVNLIAMSILLSTFVSSWGVVTPYITDNPLVIKAGDSKTLNLELQNMEDDSKIVTIRAESSNSSTLLVSQSEYSMEPMSRVPLLIDLNVGKYVKSGNYTAIVGAVAKSSTKETGQVGVGSAVTVKVNYTVLNPFMDLVEKIVIFALVGMVMLAFVLKTWVIVSWIKQNFGMVGSQ
jgi:hypothetical protein